MSNAENTGASLLEELARLDRLEGEIAETEDLLANLKDDYEATGIRAKGLFTSMSSILARFVLPMPDPVEPMPQPDPVVMDPEPAPVDGPVEVVPDPDVVVVDAGEPETVMLDEPTPEPAPTPAEPVTTVGDLATDPLPDPEPEVEPLDTVEDEPEAETEPEAPADPAPAPPVKGIP